MVASFIGIIISKSLGFIITNILFQLIPGLLFLFFFYYFSFHTGKELEKNYDLSGILILLLTYVLNFILVGASSAISLREINEGLQIFDVFTKSGNTNNNNEKENKDKKKIILVKLVNQKAWLLIFLLLYHLFFSRVYLYY